MSLIEAEKKYLSKVFCCTWGDLQSFVSFYQVVKVIDSKTVVLRELESKYTPHYPKQLSGDVTPILNSFREERTYIKELTFEGEEVFTTCKINKKAVLMKNTEKPQFTSLYFMEDTNSTKYTSSYA